MYGLRFRAAVVDGEEVQIVERESLGGLDMSAVPEYIANWLRWSAEFVVRHESFFLGYRVVGPRGSVLWLLLFETQTGLQRVHVEHVSCGRCGGLVDVANPTVPDLYWASPKEKEALERAWAQPEVACPKCAAKLGRRAIWAHEGSSG